MRLAVAIFLLAGATALASSPGKAADQGKSYDPRAAFAETDTNKDGSVDLGEFHTRLVEVFYQTDADKDGFLTIEEYKQLPLSNDFERADTNDDGKLSLDEFIAVRYQEFEEADNEHDGALSVEEVVEAFEGTSR